ncbi:hypothetical protein CVIRNUC_003418 [Coccomyxa viridis]|uniref:Uncharacterized protein n=1 Tax=Coccomyxa viridis TaxID=1274662 RepID=A0AAV1HZ07_9CHLO|nr:hypothetical protein CVIRNUC_003418 [Coccomyxa viridis]
MVNLAYPDLKGDDVTTAEVSVCQSIFPNATDTTQCTSANATGLVGQSINFPSVCLGLAANATNMTTQISGNATDATTQISANATNTTTQTLNMPSDAYSYKRDNQGLPSTCLDGEDKSAGLCYPKCPSDGNQWVGRGPVCWSKTPYFPNFAAWGRGVGRPMRCPSGQEYSIAGVGCFYPCVQGFKAVGAICYR